MFEIYTFTVSRKVKPYNVRVCIGSEPINIELDTGASLSTIGEKVYRDKLSRYKLDWKGIFRVSESPVESEFMGTSEWPKGFTKFLKEKANLFSRKGTGIKGFSANLKLKEGAKPVYQKARPVPYALCKDVEKEYERLVESDILFPVTYSEYIGPQYMCLRRQRALLEFVGTTKRSMNC